VTWSGVDTAATLRYWLFLPPLGHATGIVQSARRLHPTPQLLQTAWQMLQPVTSIETCSKSYQKYYAMKHDQGDIIVRLLTKIQRRDAEKKTYEQDAKSSSCFALSAEKLLQFATKLRLPGYLKPCRLPARLRRSRPSVHQNQRKMFRARGS
jgi:hypothetical protein